MDRSAWFPPTDRPCRKSLCALRKSISLLFDPNRCGGLPDSHERCPIEWTHLVTILCQQVQLRASERRTGVLALAESLVETIHQRTRERVVGAPQARDDRFRTRYQKRFH